MEIGSSLLQRWEALRKARQSQGMGSRWVGTSRGGALGSGWEGSSRGHAEAAGSQQVLSLVCMKVTHRFMDLGGLS